LTEVITSQTHVARSATFLFIQGFLNSVLGVLYVWFLLHTKELTGQILFTDADMGLLTMLSFILSLSSTLGVLALRSASVRFISRYFAEGRKKKAESVISRVLQLSVLTSIIVFVLLLGLAGLLSDTFVSSIVIFQLLPLSSVFMIFYSQAQGFLQGLQRMRELAIIGVIYTTFRYSIGVFLVYMGYGVTGIVIGWVFSLGFSVTFSFYIAFRYLKLSPNPHRFRPLITFSFPIYVSTLLTFVVGWVDQIFVFPFLGIEALGVYNLAVRASIVPSLISIAIVTSLYPKLSELYSKFGAKGLRDAFKTSTRYAAILGFPVSLMVATLAYPIIILFATFSFQEAVGPLAVMCVASLPTILGVAIFPTLYTLERTRVASLITVISILSEVCFAYASLVYFNVGLSGVAVSRFLAALVRFLLGVYVLRSSVKVKFDVEAVLKSAVASVLMVLSLFFLEYGRSIIQPQDYKFLVLRLRLLPFYAVVGIAAYLLSLIFLRTIKSRDLKLLHDYLPSRLKWIVKILSHIPLKD